MLLKINKNQGFTFLEVMVALSVLALILTAVFKIYTQSVSMLLFTDFDIKAPMLAQQIIGEKKGAEESFDKEDGTFGEEFPFYKWKLEKKEISLDDLKESFPEGIKSLKFKKATITISNSDNRKYTTFFYEKNSSAHER